MALTFFESKEDNGSGELEFFSEWLEKNPKPKNKEFEVIECKASKSGKGYMLVTNDFQIWLWKKQKLAQQLLEAFDVWVNKEPDTGFKLVVVLDPKAKDKYRVGVDKETKVTWFQMGNGYTQWEQSAYSEETDLNPFL
jgi:hypothetical protein